MKKVFLAIAIIFSVSVKAQDTTFYQKRNDLYMSIRTKVADSSIYKKEYSLKVKKRQRNDKIFTIVVGTIFASLTAWYWGK
jgi:cell division protein FtsL